MTWVGVAVAVGSSLVGMEQQQQVAKKQDQTLANQIRQQMATQQKIAQRTAALTQKEAKTLPNDQPQQQAAQTQLTNAVKANASTAAAPEQVVGDTSAAYKKATQDAALGVSDYTKQRAANVAGMMAPGLARQQNQRTLADYNIGTNDLLRQQSGQNFLDQLKLNSIHANPWVGLLTSAGMAYGAKKAGASGDPWSYNGPSTDIAGNTAAGGIDLSG